MTDKSHSSVEEKIVQAAIECIEKYGINGATNRRIAAIAGVNNAAINYYFRSKDVLINRCMEVTLDNAFDWDDIAPTLTGSPRERCALVFNDLIAGGINFPGITRAHFYTMVAEGKYDQLLVQKLESFIENLARDLAEHGVALDMDELHLACVQITAAVTMMILAPRLYEKKFGIDLSNPVIRAKFVNRLVDRLLS